MSYTAVVFQRIADRDVLAKRFEELGLRRVL